MIFGNGYTLRTNFTLILHLNRQDVFYVKRVLDISPRTFTREVKKSKVTLHAAGWINWHEKCESLEFYKDETPEASSPRPGKPIKSKFESETEFSQRLVEWGSLTPSKGLN